jgi:hypothetical protein
MVFIYPIIFDNPKVLHRLFQNKKQFKLLKIGMYAGRNLTAITVGNNQYIFTGKSQKRRLFANGDKQHANR